MKFSEKLNAYIEKSDCTAKDFCTRAGISPATLSRYRSGERVPEVNGDAFSGLCSAIAEYTNSDPENVREEFIGCEDVVSADREQLRQNLNLLISVMDINVSKLCKYINYDVSTLFRFRNGTRRPSDPEQFASAVATYVAEEFSSESERAALNELVGQTDDMRQGIKRWLLEGQGRENGGISDFLTKLDGFDLNEYIKAIRFDELKVPTVPFQLPTSKHYYGIKEMMESELDFLKATVLSKSQKPVTLYSDMPMGEMAKDPEFPKKWMFGMAMMLKKGLHLNNIHNIDRSFDEMMLGLESWIPMYMTGQISPYYLKNVQKGVFNHFLRVSGAAALSGEAISGYHGDGRYYLSKIKEDIAYYQKRADDLLKNAYPLMEIYRADRAASLNAFLLKEASKAGLRRNILSVPPLYTLDETFLDEMLRNTEQREQILEFVRAEKKVLALILENGTVTDEIPVLTREEFDLHPPVLPLSGMFSDSDIAYTFEEYTENLRQTREFAENNKNYNVIFTEGNPFRNLQIFIHQGQWAMISKGNSPAIHFVIHHPKLRSAIENFVPPLVEKK